MQISVVRPSELGPVEISAWHSMQRKTESLTNPFLCPEFAVAVDKFRSDARVAVLTEGAGIAGFFPFQRRHLGVGVPIGAGLNDCQGVIHAPGLEWNPQELIKACKMSVWQFDHLIQAQRSFDRYKTATAASPVIDLADGFPAYYQKLQIESPRFCKDVERKTRTLALTVGELSFIMDSRDSSRLRSLIAWKSGQCRRNNWINLFDRPWVIDFLDYLFSSHNDHFGGLLSVLYAGDTPVAAHFGLRSGHVLAAWFPAYDTRYARQSPGLIQFLRMSEETVTAGVRLISLGKGTARFKETLKSYDAFVAEGMVAGGPLLATAHRARRSAVRWAGPRIRRHPNLFRPTEQLLRHYGRI
jgi:CelD/BcsL family acetyltransferase involved in cellulose biosynthesis